MRRIFVALTVAGVATLAACVARAPSPATYSLCNTAGCGDNVNFVFVNDLDNVE